MIKRRFSEIAMALSLAVIFAAPPASVLAGDYRLGVSDRVKIKVQEWPDLGGEYTVTPDGVISLPMIGNIDAVGLRLNDLAKEISDRLQRRYEGAERILAAIEIAQYRPFAILGDVQKPGQYPYRPGLTVLEAISIAGGYYRPELGLLRLGRDVALATGEINTQDVKLNGLIAREARLSAVLDGREEASQLALQCAKIFGLEDTVLFGRALLMLANARSTVAPVSRDITSKNSVSVETG